LDQKENQKKGENHLFIFTFNRTALMGIKQKKARFRMKALINAMTAGKPA
jgi:hypothetical protein